MFLKTVKAEDWLILLLIDNGLQKIVPIDANVASPFSTGVDRRICNGKKKIRERGQRDERNASECARAKKGVRENARRTS